MINVKKDWWKDYFNETYLITDARSVLDDDLTRREVDLVEDLLRLDRNDRILDLFGGQGRHSLELARRGYHNLFVLDYSPFLIRIGKGRAKENNLKIKFYKRDARSSELGGGSFTAVLVMANSFGYFENETDDRRVLEEAKRLLMKGGRFLLDLTDADYARKNLVPESRHESGDDITIYRTRELEGDMIKAREVVASKKKGLIRDGTYSERLYTEEKIKAILNELGYKDISVHKGVRLHKEKKDYGFLTSRMMVTAVKRG